MKILILGHSSHSGDGVCLFPSSNFINLIFENSIERMMLISIEFVQVSTLQTPPQTQVAGFMKNGVGSEIQKADGQSPNNMLTVVDYFGVPTVEKPTMESATIIIFDAKNDTNFVFLNNNTNI